MKKIIYPIISIISTIIIFIGCKNQKFGSENSNYTLLNNTTWQVVSLNKNPIDKSQNIPFITFDTNEMKISGSAGCNRISGEFKAQSNSNQMTFGPIIATKMACRNMETEKAFLNLSEKINYFNIENKKLILYDLSHNELISFTQKK